MAGNWFGGGFGLAISDKMVVAIVNRSERCVQVYGVDDAGGITSWVNRRLTRGLVTPYDVAFAPSNYLVVTDPGDSRVKVYDLKNELRLVREIVIQSPQNVVIGPGPPSLMFVVCGNGLVLLMNMDWKEVILKSISVIFPPIYWYGAPWQFYSRIMCDNLSIVEDHKNSHRVGGRNPLALNTAQFCAMFYHVTQRKQITYCCLEKSRCSVGIGGNKNALSATVVVYVRIIDGRGCLIFQARYGNCYQGPTENTIHAEYFMLMDTEFRDAVGMLRTERGGYIELYMNKQPCYFSTGKPGHCAQDLVTFYNNQCAPHGIKLAINLCQLYKADMHPSQGSIKLANEIRNSKQGMKMMMVAGIELKAMNDDTWRRLADYAVVNLPEYQASSREALDQHISVFIEDLKGRDCKQSSSPGNAFNLSEQNSLKTERNKPEFKDSSASKISGAEDQRVVKSVDTVVKAALAGSKDDTFVSDEHYQCDVVETAVGGVSKDRKRNSEVQRDSKRVEWKQPSVKSSLSLAHVTCSSAGFKYKMAPNWQMGSKVPLLTPHPSDCKSATVSTSQRSEGESRVESSPEQKLLPVKTESTELTTQDQAKASEITTEKATSQADSSQESTSSLKVHLSTSSVPEGQDWQPRRRKSKIKNRQAAARRCSYDAL